MVVRKPTVNSNPGLKVNQIITVSSIQMSFVYIFFLCISFMIIKLKIEGQTISENLTAKLQNLNQNSTLS